MCSQFSTTVVRGPQLGPPAARLEKGPTRQNSGRRVALQLLSPVTADLQRSGADPGLQGSVPESIPAGAVRTGKLTGPCGRESEIRGRRVSKLRIKGCVRGVRLEDWGPREPQAWWPSWGLAAVTAPTPVLQSRPRPQVRLQPGRDSQRQ